MILAYSEGINDGDRLVAALEQAAKAQKPVVFMKVGRSEIGAAAANSHTASLTGQDDVVDAVFRQYGVHRADTTEDLIDIAYGAMKGRLPGGRRLGLITISGGVGVLMADAASDHGLDVAPMGEESQKKLVDMLPFAAARNPVDVTAQVLNELDLMPEFFATMLGEGGYDVLLAFFTSIAASPLTAGHFLEAMGTLRQEHPEAFLVLSVLASGEAKADYEALGFPVFEDPSRAVAAIAALTRFTETFARIADRKPIAAAAPAALPDGKLSEADAKRVLAEAGLPVLAETLARTREEAVAAAGDDRVAMKIVSPDVLHKTEIGGVLLDVQGAQAVGDAFDTLAGRLKAHHPQAALDGILVSPMVEGGVETILGVSRDPVFGPVVMLGLGGVLVEVLKDVSFRKAPFDLAEAREMIGELRGAAILDGVRGAPPADRDALAQALVGLSRFAAANAETVESVDLNPFVVLEEGKGAVALDALIVKREA